MIYYLTHYYRKDNKPFQSLSALPDHEAIEIMQKLCDDTAYGNRFKDPENYLEKRKETEKWVREEFKKKGGRPRDPYPIPMVLGTSKWLEKATPIPELHGEIYIPLSIFSESDISFTYPDSMVSRWFGRDKPAEYYQADLHGKVFTRSEILAIVEEKGMPEEDWETNLPASLAPYIEAQVWHHDLLLDFED